MKYYNTGKIFVTGASGFIGRGLVDKLLERGYKVTVLIRNNDFEMYFKKKGVNVVIGDITKLEKVKDIIADQTTIIHLAGIRSNWASKELFDRVNNKAIANLFIKKSKIRHVIITSSVYTMGELDHLPANETSPLRAKDPYGISKILAEETTKKSAQVTQIRYTIIRPAIVYGPGDNDLGMINKLFTLISDKKFSFIGNGKNYIHLIFLDDLINGYIKAIEKGGNNETYILAGNKPIRLINLIRIIKKDLNIDSKEIYLPKFLILILGLLTEFMWPFFFKNEPPVSKIKINTISANWHYDISKARKELGFNPKIDYKEGIAKTAKWFIKNGLAKKY